MESPKTLASAASPVQESGGAAMGFPDCKVREHLSLYASGKRNLYCGIAFIRSTCGHVYGAFS